MMGSMNEIMRLFSVFLNQSWEFALASITRLEGMNSDELMSDWAQANWELLVETAFRKSVGFGDSFLESYGEGADCNESSSRVWRPEVLPTHRIVCKVQTGQTMLDLLTGDVINVAAGPVVFDRFASRSEDGWHREVPPFDCVLGYRNSHEVLLRVDDVDFVPERIRDTTAG